MLVKFESTNQHDEVNRTINLHKVKYFLRPASYFDPAFWVAKVE